MADIRVLSPPNFGNADAQLRQLYQYEQNQAIAFEKEQFNRAKGTVASLINSYHKADSQALQQDIVDMMKSYTSTLPISLKAAVNPYIQHGPTSPMAEKARQFRNFMGDPPKLPVLNEAPGEIAEMENIQALSAHYFANEDYQRQREIFMLGSDAARPKASLFMFPNGKGAAIRGKDKRITYLSPQDLNLKDVEEKYGITPKEFILNNGQIPTGKKGFLFKEGRMINTEEVLDFTTNTHYSRPTSVKQMPKSAFYQQYPSNLVKLAMEWKNYNTDDEVVKDLRTRASKSPKERINVQQELSSLYPGYSFSIITKKDPLWRRIMDWIPLVTAMVSVGQEQALIPIKGVPTPFPKGSGGQDILYYDPDLDRVYDKTGKYLGTYEQAATLVKTK